MKENSEKNEKNIVAKLIGRQFVRLDFTRMYLMIIMSMVTAFSTFAVYLSTLGIKISLDVYAVSMLIVIVVGWFIGLLMDKSGVIEEDRQLRNVVQYKAHENLWREAIKPVILEIFREVKDEIKSLLKEVAKELKEEGVL